MADQPERPPNAPPVPAPKLPPPSSIPHQVIEKGIGGGGGIKQR